MAAALPAPRIVGHRGAAMRAPENTLAGFRKARELGARWVEFDVQATRDGCPMLLHDARLERTTNGHGMVADRVAADVAALDAGAWFGAAFRGERVPRLDEALALIDELGMGAVIEVKSGPKDGPRTMNAALDALDTRAPGNGTILSSFDEAALAVAATRRPDLPRALIVRDVPPDWRSRIERLGCTALHASERRLAPATAAAIAAHGTLRVYTVNRAARAATLFSWRVAAVFTDCPDVIISGTGHGPEGPDEPPQRGADE